jgi:hypothetical protein
MEAPRTAVNMQLIEDAEQGNKEEQDCNTNEQKTDANDKTSDASKEGVDSEEKGEEAEQQEECLFDDYPDEFEESMAAPSRGAKAMMRPIIISPTDEVIYGTSHQAKLIKWHRKTGHINFHYLRKVAPGIPGMEEIADMPYSTELPPCEACIRAKSKRKPLPKATFKRTSERFAKLHSDMSGKVRNASYGGSNYFVVFIDDATNMKWVDVMRTKNEFVSKLDDLIVRQGKAPSMLRTDNAGEMVGNEAKIYYKAHHIAHQACNAYEHHGNGRAESAIGTLSTRARALLAQSGAPRGYWPQALHYAAELDNRLTPTSSNSNMTCYQAFHNIAPDNSKIITWGCQTWMWIEKNRRTDQRWDDTAIPCIFLGFAFHLGHKGYLL